MKSTVLYLSICIFNISGSTAMPNFNNVSSVEDSFGAVKGVVLDVRTRNPLRGVNITVEGTRRGTVTNHNGEFIISKVLIGKQTIIFSYIGYAKKTVDGVMILPDKTVDLQLIGMEEQPIPLKEIVVTPGSYSIMGTQPTFSQTLTNDDIKMMGWAEDITRAVQRIPGTTSDEYSAKFSIRGGDTDEILVLVDGMQLFKPFHQKDFGGGLYSTVDIETIEGVNLLTGGFVADYGDRMSGVLNMKTKTPKKNQTQTSIGLSIMNARLFSMGTFNKNKGSWLLSARRGYLDLVNKLMGNAFKLEPTYYDILGKLELKLNKNHTLSLYGFLANDSYKLDEKVKEPNTTWFNIDFVNTKYGNNYSWLTLKSQLSRRLYARTILYGGSVTQKRFWNLFDLDPQAHLNSATLNGNRDLGFFGLKQDWDYQVSNHIFFKLGADIKRLNAKYNYSKDIKNEFITTDNNLIEQVEEFKADKTVDGTQVGIFLSSRFKILSPLILETGIRYDNASYTNDKLWSPRISMAYSLTKTTVLRAGWGYYYQMQSIDELDIQFGDLSFHPAELAEHYVMGFEHLFHNGLQLRAEGYFKKMSNLRDAYYTFRDIDEFFPEAKSDLIRLSSNKATAKGIELYLKYDTGNKFSWWLSYVLSDAKDEVLDIQYEGKLIKQTGELPRPWDQRHTFNLDANYRLSKKWHFNIAWQYHTGWPSTDFTVQRIKREDGTFAYYHDHGIFRGSRVPSYQRLDLRINRQYFKSSGTITVFLHVINLYNHVNIIRYDHDILNDNLDTFNAEIGPESWFGILPFAGVSWEF